MMMMMMFFFLINIASEFFRITLESQAYKWIAFQTPCYMNAICDTILIEKVQKICSHTSCYNIDFSRY